jgi:hypothetical protein
LFLSTDGGVKFHLTMFIFPRPLFPVVATLALLLLLALLSVVYGG